MNDTFVILYRIFGFYVCLHDCANICKCYLPINGITVFIYAFDLACNQYGTLQSKVSFLMNYLFASVAASNNTKNKNTFKR